MEESDEPHVRHSLPFLIITHHYPSIINFKQTWSYSTTIVVNLTKCK